MFLRWSSQPFYLTRQSAEGFLGYYGWHGTFLLLGKLTLAAGLCTMIADVWNWTKGKSWLLVLNGIACSALGALLAFWTGPLAFRAIALLVVVMALSIGIYELVSSRFSRRVWDEWLLRIAGLTCLGFVVAFLAFVFRWLKLDAGAPMQSLHWLGSYFGVSGVCMLLLILSLYKRLPERA